MTRTHLGLAATLLLVAACKPPKPPPFEHKDRCETSGNQSEPLIVEWSSAARAKLEAVARRGTVVVSYADCQMRVLAHCRAPGTYAFTPTTRKRDVVTISDSDELYANIPVGAAKLEGKLQSSGQLNVSMTIVGRYDASSVQINQQDLQGDCAGATHVIAGLTTGSFKFFAGAADEASASATVLGAGTGGKSTSKSELLNEDGDEASCANAKNTATSPPDGCAAILRVEVVALGKPKSDAPTCPAGTTWDGKQCHGASSKIVPPDPCETFAACLKKCETANNANACNAAGFFIANGKNGTPVDKARAATLYRRACDAGLAKACSNLGGMYYLGQGGLPVDKTRAVALNKIGCDADVNEACNNLGASYDAGEGGLPLDPHKAWELYVRACDLGAERACANIAWRHYYGVNAALDKVAAAKFSMRACDGGDPKGCTVLGMMTERGEGGITKDGAAAAKLYKKACDSEIQPSAEACGHLARMYRDGAGGLPADAARAAKLYERGCNAEPHDECNALGAMYELGDGGLPVDAAKAVSLYRRGCEGGSAASCFSLAAAYENGRGGLQTSPSTALVFYQRACDAQLPTACVAVKRLGKS